MPSIQRILPSTIEGRLLALNAAKSKEALLPVGTIIISAATKTRMLASQSAYSAAVLALGPATSVSTGATRVKNDAQALAKMWSSHYYQALNNGIDREVFPPEVRGLFSIPVSSGAVPAMDSEDKVTLWGDRVGTGATAMAAAGHLPVGFPLAADVTVKVADYNTKLGTQSTAVGATDAAEEAITNLNIEADKVIKKVWDEVETYYNEEPAESMRDNAREWGVKYATLGDPTQVSLRLNIV